MVNKTLDDIFHFETIQYYSEELNASGIMEHLDRQRALASKFEYKTVNGKKARTGCINDREAIVMYAFIREIQPRLLVETGVCNGFSTTIILQAIRENGVGFLYSIDLPEVMGKEYKPGAFWEGKGGAAIPPQKDSGWVVPKCLRASWRLILGKSQEKLSDVLNEIGLIDFFFHDSEHSYECLTFELNSADDHMNAGGLIVADDIHCNNAFQDFCRQKCYKPLYLHRMGFTQK
ncbi:MAG: class I SAM-dependent methyltransferase [Candidatus Omnitrophica bacterium]|nr:class I SAM-dependent methyltransferase [Candidatus Omnitrophota bacterium]